MSPEIPACTGLVPEGLGISMRRCGRPAATFRIWKSGSPKAFCDKCAKYYHFFAKYMGSDSEESTIEEYLVALVMES